MSEKGGRRPKCVFTDWDCPIRGDIPLEVCRLCIEARRVRLIGKSIGRG